MLDSKREIIISSDLLNDEGYYFHVCKNGHKSVIISQTMKFEDLFDNGANAIIDGYYREGVLSFAASLERFYEYFIKVVMASKVSDLKIIELSWGCVKKQSERQLGAFIFTYAAFFNSKPEIISEKLFNLRNKVAHNGYIPKRNEAINYGQCVIDLIVPIILRLNDEYKKQVLEMIDFKLISGNEYFMEQKKIHGDDVRRSISRSTTILSLANDDLKTLNLNDELDKILKRREKFGF
ncbi:hypothetical protein IBT47_10495 [Erwinia sp. S43]|uniref:hypothetical protein n=1 Tax=Erwinia sp. S43 TaxID=2769339 RepID=UPI00190DFF09|nr:hypothetical protein [Erwinia sp. S43]MBK0032711.1 hypothetical protein [Erwinia sp. S43]